MERHILREGTSSCPVSSSGSQRWPTLAPTFKTYRQRRLNVSDRLRVPGSTHDSLHSVSTWPCCSHITWSPSGYTLVGPDCPDAFLSSCLLITTWQLFKAHGVTWNELKIHVICYITLAYFYLEYKIYLNNALSAGAVE